VIPIRIPQLLLFRRLCYCLSIRPQRTSGADTKNYKITGKIWHLLKGNSRNVRVRVLHALIDQKDEVDILRGLPEGSRLSPTLFGNCVAELILELRAKFPLLEFPQITSIDNLNWIAAFLYAFLYVNYMVLIARSPVQLQSMIDNCQDWAERSRMRINYEKTEVMMFYETPPQRTTRSPSTFHITTRFPLSQPPSQLLRTLPLKEPPTFKYLGLTLDPYLTMEAAMKHMLEYQRSTSNSGCCCPQPEIRLLSHR